MTMLVPPKKDAPLFIERKVREGEFSTVEEAVDAAVERIAEDDQRLTELNAALQIGIDELDRGERIAWSPELMDEIWEEAMRRFDVGEKPDPDVLPWLQLPHASSSRSLDMVRHHSEHCTVVGLQNLSLSVSFTYEHHVCAGDLGAISGSVRSTRRADTRSAALHERRPTKVRGNLIRFA